MIDIICNPRNGNGFDLLHSFEGWKVAFITYAEQYAQLKILKRHVLSDEIFLLVKGNAKLFTLNDDGRLTTVTLKKEQIYNVKKNTWHHLQVSSDALLFVVENSNTSNENTESLLLSEKQKRRWLYDNIQYD